MLVQVAPDMLVNPEAIDVVTKSEAEGVTLVFFNGSEYPSRAGVDYDTFIANLEKGKRRGFFKRLLRKS
jgi:hypothetical protein